MLILYDCAQKSKQSVNEFNELLAYDESDQHVDENNV